MASTEHIAPSALIRARLLCVLCVGILLQPAAAQLSAFVPMGGSGSRQDRKNAVAAIPFQRLTPPAAARIHAVVSKPSIYRRLPIKTIESDPQLFVFLVRNPEVVVDVWQLMGITQLTIQRTGEFTFTSSDGAGTDSQVELVYGTPNLHVYFGTGVYQGPLLKKRVTGHCVLVLRSDFEAVGGRPHVRNRLDVFMRVDKGAADVIAKTVAPLFGRTADINFVETARFLGRLSEAAENSSSGIERLANRLPTVTPQVRRNFTQVASTIQDRLHRVDASRTHRTTRPPVHGPVRPAAAEQPSGLTRQATRISRLVPERMLLR